MNQHCYITILTRPLARQTHIAALLLFHIVDLTTAVLPSAIDLVPMLHVGLKTLRKMIMQDKFQSELLFHYNGKPRGRNWPNDSVIKKLTGYCCGELRKSVETESYKAHAADPTNFTLEICAQVNHTLHEHWALSLRKLQDLRHHVFGVVEDHLPATQQVRQGV